MATNNTTLANKNQKKANLMDHNSIKRILDESVSEIVKDSGYKEDLRTSNIKLLLGTILIIIALFAQFYYKKFPDNKNFLIGCIILYVLFGGLLQLIMYAKENNAILVTFPIAGSFKSTGLVVSSKFSRFSDKYTLTIASSDPKSASVKQPAELTKSATQWFTKEGVLVEGLFGKDVQGLINEYAKGVKKIK